MRNDTNEPDNFIIPGYPKVLVPLVISRVPLNLVLTFKYKKK